MTKRRNVFLTPQVLASYQNAAITNATQLVTEAKHLFAAEHHARGYFLALSSIEETGKAYIAFCARGRNLKDNGLCKKIAQQFDNHLTKLVNAFIPYILQSPNPGEASKAARDLSAALATQRECALYVDLNFDGTLSVPTALTRPTATRNSLSVAEICLQNCITYLQRHNPPPSSSYDDKLLCITSKTIAKILATDDFSQYYLSQTNLEHASDSFNMAVVCYHDNYYKRDRRYCQSWDSTKVAQPGPVPACNKVQGD